MSDALNKALELGRWLNIGSMRRFLVLSDDAHRLLAESPGGTARLAPGIHAGVYEARGMPGDARPSEHPPTDAARWTKRFAPEPKIYGAIVWVHADTREAAAWVGRYFPAELACIALDPIKETFAARVANASQRIALIQKEADEAEEELLAIEELLRRLTGVAPHPTPEAS